MKVYLRAVTHPSPNEWGSGRPMFESEQRRVLLGGYRVVEPADEGQRHQMDGYDVLIEASGEWGTGRFALSVRLDEGDE